jgi:maltokinase
MTVDPLTVVTDLAESLRGWLPAQRWFAGKGRELTEVRPLSARLLPGTPDAELLHTIVEVVPGEDRYQLLIGLRHDLPEHLEYGMLGMWHEKHCYEAIYDQELTGMLIELIRQKAEISEIRFEIEPGVEFDSVPRGRVLGVEQSNSSVVFGNQYILKIFRKLFAGTNQDLLLTRELATVGSEHIATPLGSITGPFPTGGDCTYAMVQRYLPDAAEGWAMATASVRDLLMRDTRTSADIRPGDLGGDFAGESFRLGLAVADVHHDLDRALGHAEESVAEFQHTVDRMHTRLDHVLTIVPDLVEVESTIRAIFDETRELPTPVRVQRVHGDLHLGQVLRTVHGWVLIDFEGEPGTPAAERRLMRSPLRDVAGVLRSYDYAAHHLLVGQGRPGLPPLGERSRIRALDWTSRNRQSFCDGYARGCGVDPGAHRVLLRALELDKALYEVTYEHDHRPEWVVIPLASIARMTLSPAETS